MAYFGRMVWCHVAQSWAAMCHPFISFLVMEKIVMDSTGFEPMNSGPGEIFGKAGLPACPLVVLNNYMVLYKFKLQWL